MNHLADAVRTERLGRNWSVRKCAAESGGLLTNTWWGKFEDGQQPLTETIRQGVANAFGWDSDWPESTRAPLSAEEGQAIRDRLDRIERHLDLPPIDSPANVTNENFALAASQEPDATEPPRRGKTRKLQADPEQGDTNP